MEEDIRCCGTGTCLINAEGHCWCGQQWDGTRMCFAQHSAGPKVPMFGDFSKTTPTPVPFLEKPKL